MKEKIVRVHALARVEGEGSLYIKVRRGRIEDLRFKIFEPPRFFEAFLKGKPYDQIPDITARICGICPVAYQMSSVHAVEAAFGAVVPEGVRELRRLLYCGEWIESHALHVFMLHAPDFLGFPDALEMVKKHRRLVETGLRIKKAGNALVALLGGREIHPVSVKVGGFYKAPTAARLKELAGELAWAKAASEEALAWAAGLDCPDFSPRQEYVALRHPEEYPMNEGRLASSGGLDLAPADFSKRFREVQSPHSNALHCLLDGRPYFVGPQARFNLNFDRLPPGLRSLCLKAGLEPPVRNPFRSIGVRLAETAYACGEALRLIEGYREPKPPYTEVRPRASEGHACTEAPRGVLYHRYRLAEDGSVLEAQIVPPTSQNQPRIEADLRELVPGLLKLKQAEFERRCEQAVRNYDPCISCATHFLDVRLDSDA